MAQIDTQAARERLEREKQEAEKMRQYAIKTGDSFGQHVCEKIAESMSGFEWLKE